jgi:hypothetical protein
MYGWGRAPPEKVASHDSLPCKSSHNWSPSVCSCLCRVMMCTAIENPASCEFRALHCELCVVYGQNVTTEGNARQWDRMFKDGRASKCPRWSAMWSAGYLWSVTSCSKRWPKRNFWKTALHNFRTFVWISTNFAHSSLRDYHSSARLSQASRKMGSENAHGCAQTAENDFGFDFLER